MARFLFCSFALVLLYPSGIDMYLVGLPHIARDLGASEAQLLGAWAGELLAEELRLAQQNLSEITGEFTSDDLLGRIFSSFCIGK